MLKTIKNPVGEAYEIKVRVPESTFLGVHKQPDYVDLFITFYPEKSVIELKFLKEYIVQLRNIVVSNERLINVTQDSPSTPIGKPAVVKKSSSIGNTG